MSPRMAPIAKNRMDQLLLVKKSKRLEMVAIKMAQTANTSGVYLCAKSSNCCVETPDLILFSNLLSISLPSLGGVFLEDLSVESLPLKGIFKV